ncbi:hypothetical protein SAMN05216276_108615 [Streptosporangium subroseum]|uniref:Uncharacterized protein n=1 Tax=Streptosporangium subroseum TaxID=106412 RepID=A0A239P4A4_9ACTN|nr:DUF6338 family protein [Streptosporangium subroseum]SNT61906.1 hypothetical protein SAMN05216276_108615 [Streptosporangium subroseum]
MIPGDVGIGLLLLALVPGWLYLRLRERLRPRSGATGLNELIEILAVGLVTTGVAAFLLLIAVPHSWLPFLVDVQAWAKSGTGYLRQNVHLAANSIASILLVASSIACGLYLLNRRRVPAEFEPQGGVWVHSLGARPRGTVPWVGLRLNDGTLLEGVLHSYTLTESALEARDIALQAPIMMTDSSQVRHPLALDRFIVSGKEIAHISIVHTKGEVGRRTPGSLTKLFRSLRSKAVQQVTSALRRSPRPTATPDPPQLSAPASAPSASAAHTSRDPEATVVP